MDPTNAVSVILFAIQSAIKLGQAVRQAYIDAASGAALVLPLPDFQTDVTVKQAVQFFSLLAANALPPSVAPLLKKDAAEGLTANDQADLVKFYLEAQLLDDKTWTKITATPDGAFLTQDAVKAMVLIRQWDPSRNPNPSALQRVAGTLFEIGVDYFTQVPGALNDHSAQGKAVKALLTSLDEIDFATIDPQDLLPRLFTATIETLAAHPDIISKNAHTDTLIQLTANALAKDVKQRIADGRKVNGPNLNAEQQIVSWADVVYRSVLEGAGEAAAKDPATYLGIKNPGQAARVSDVSQALLGFVLDGHDGQTAREIGKEALDAVLKSALNAIGDHPELVLRTKNAGLENLLVATAKTIGAYDDLLTPKIVPVITQAILDNTLKNLELIWPHGSVDPADHLLLTAADTVLKILTTQSPADQWRPSFTTSDAVAVVEAVFQELITNPGWLVTKAGKLDPSLSDALNAVLGVLRAKADARLNADTARSIISAALSGVALHQPFLQKLATSGQLKIAAAIDSIVSVIFNPELQAAAAGRLVRSNVIQAMVAIGLDKLGRTDLTDARLQNFLNVIQAQATRIANGQPWDEVAFANAVQAAL
jgi:hypothetical protein